MKIKFTRVAVWSVLSLGLACLTWGCNQAVNSQINSPTNQKQQTQPQPPQNSCNQSKKGCGCR